MRVYLLDKNIVEDIRSSLNNIPSPGVALARSVDRKGAIISPLLSIAEGNIRKPQTSGEILSSMRIETQAVGMFYNHARTDAHYLQNNDVELIIALGTHWREKTKELLPLANSLQVLLSRTYSISDTKDVFSKIDLLCGSHSVSRVHPLVTCAIACLYGNMSARRVIKPAKNPSEGDSYNAVSDIRMLLETAYLREMFQKHSPNMGVSLLSGDKKLNEFARDIGVVVEKSILLTDFNLQLVNFKATIDKKLFPMLNNKPKELAYIYSYFEESEKDFNLNLSR